MSHRKAETLGMPHGTANNRLRKSIMFKYVKLAGDNFCFKCGAEIETVDDISVEHKEPWEGVSASLFFDLDNVAFSHRHCNKPDRPKTPRINIYQGLKHCYLCKEFKSVDNFYCDNTRDDKRQRHCKDCHKSWRRRAKNSERF